MNNYEITIRLVIHEVFDVVEEIVAVNTFKSTSYDVACAYANSLAESMGQHYQFDSRMDFFSASVKEI